MNFSFSMLFAPKDLYQACGMFTKEHLLLLVLNLILLCILLFCSRNITKEKIATLTRVFAIMIVILEQIKIGFNFRMGYTWLDSWFPISYCSIFIYALVLSGFFSGKGRAMGKAYIAGVSVLAGFVYLLFPSTSLMQYPVWHFLSLHSMFFHTLMMYMGILYLYHLKIRLDKKAYYHYILLFGFFAVLALILNTLFGSNLMLLREPFNIPLPLAHQIYQKFPWGYTVLVLFVYLVLPFPVTALLFRRREERTLNNKKTK